MKKKRYKSEGICKLCGQDLEGGKISGHLEKCRQRLLSGSGTNTETVMQISARGGYGADYWLQLAARGSAKLSDIDKFLRHVWLECCGHLSLFNINGMRYESHPDDDGIFSFDPKPLSMSVQLNKVLKPGTLFVHEYDFGTTTQLELEVLDVFQASKLETPVLLLAHNLIPKIKCGSCGNSVATLICSGCYDFQCFCEKCAPKHECGEDMMLPLVNSPRTGMCGYGGPGL